MRFSAAFVALVAPLLTSAAPLKRAANPSDLLVLKFAHVLEQLETQFYTQALAKFQESDFTSAGFISAQTPIQQFTAIQLDESTHTTVLEATIKSLGDTPISGCQFSFDSVLTDVATMAATARVVENLGVAAYLGAAHLVTDPVLLTAAGSILTVEARHQTVLNVLNGGSAIPSAFDIPFTPQQVLAVAAPFISGCDVGVPPNPTLSLTNTGIVAPGTALTFSSAAINGSTDGLFCQMMLGGAATTIPLPYDACVVPEGINGPVAIYITSDGQPLANNIRDQETNTLIAGPTMAFIDTVVEELAISVISDSSDNGAVASAAATATATITPDQASSIIASAQGTPTALTVPAAAAATPAVNNAASVVTAVGGPNMYTGPADNGAVNIIGWSQVQA